jgi:ribokinase
MIDTIAVIDNDLIERMSMNNADRAYLLLEEGRKTEASIISTHSGGGAINAAVSFARLGCSTSSLVKLGADQRGRAIRDTLEAEGISGGFIRETDRIGTGASVIISAHERNAAIFTFRGANSLLDGSDLADEIFDTDLVYITGLSDGSANIFQDVVDRAASHGAFVAANPGIRQLSARTEAFYKALPNISLLSMNRDEAAALLPRLAELQSAMTSRPRFVSTSQGSVPDLMRSGLTASGYEQTLAQFCGSLLSLGPKCLVITDGKHGAYAALNNEIHYCPSLPCDAVGTAGAGDAFTSTFTFKYLNGSPPAEALQFATVNARSVIGFADTQSGLLRLSELDAATEAAQAEMVVQTWSKI